MNRILLVGNPNVGKSAVFSRLTGIDVITSNYPGTTVEVVFGSIKLNGEKYQVLDVPGTYSLFSTNKAEQVATEILNTATKQDIVILVLDATNLERNLFLAMQVLEKKLPTIIVLNKWDLTKHRGIIINVDNLSKRLGVPVVPIVGISGDGIKNLVDILNNFVVDTKISSIKIPHTDEGKWKLIGELCSSVQKLEHKHPTISEQLQELTITMPYALIIALFVLISSFVIIRFIGESLITYVFDPVFNNLYLPAITRFFNFVSKNQYLNQLLFGAVPKPMESFGVLTTGLYVPFVVVLPYIFAFYLILSFLEDSGYLVRLAVVLDIFFHKFGLHGYASIPILLGLGCKVPAILATRILENEREKIISVVLILMLTPCLPQTAMIFSVLGRFGLLAVLSVFFILIFVALICGLILNKILKGETPELFLEMPQYQLPTLFVLSKKLYLRIKTFLFEAVPMIISGIFIVNIFDLLGVISFISKTFGKHISTILGLPNEIAIVMISGFLRKDVSIALLTPFDLTMKQLIISSVVLVIYLPCIATFSILVREFKLKKSLVIVGIMFLLSIFLGIVLNIFIP
ncbi:MAG: ferrous iron transporter B [Endomicrobiia bacterium]